MDDHELFRSLKGQTTPAEETRVRAWRAESLDSERSYQELCVVLEATAAIACPPETVAPSVFKLIHAAETRTAAAAPESRQRRQRRARDLWYGILAGACALALGVGISRWQSPSSTRRDDPTNEIVTGASEAVMLTLHDGTVIRLGPNSRLRVSTVADARLVSLEGRAFFAVAHDPARPFQVQTAGGGVEVLGTRFDIEAEDGDLRVAVVEGRVAVAGRGGRREVKAGEMRRVIAGTMLPAVRIPDAPQTTRWMGNFLVFQETALVDAAREIEALYDVRIKITDDRMAEQTITTWFVDQPVEQVLAIFCLVAEAQCTTTDTLTTVEPKNRPQ